MRITKEHLKNIIKEEVENEAKIRGIRHSSVSIPGTPKDIKSELKLQIDLLSDMEAEELLNYIYSKYR